MQRLVDISVINTPDVELKKLENLDYDLVLPLLTLVSQLDRVVWRRPSDHIEQNNHSDSFSGLIFYFCAHLHLQLGTSTS